MLGPRGQRCEQGQRFDATVPTDNVAPAAGTVGHEQRMHGASFGGLRELDICGQIGPVRRFGRRVAPGGGMMAGHTDEGVEDELTSHEGLQVSGAARVLA